MIKVKLNTFEEIIKKNTNRDFKKIIKENNFYVDIEKDKLKLLYYKKESIFVFKKEKYFLIEKDDSIIIYNLGKNNKKNIIFEININEEDNKENILEFKEKLKLRNKILDIKSPLFLEYHNEEKISLFSKEDIKLNGLLRLFILLFLIHKVGKIMDLYVKAEFLFFDNLYKILKINSLMVLGICYLIILFYIIILFYLQKLSFKMKISDIVLNTIIIILTIFVLFIEPFLIFKYKTDITISFMIASISCIVLLKMISFYHVMYHVRHIIKNVKENLINNNESSDTLINNKNIKIIEKYHNNFGKFLTIKNFLYFLLAPTLCYQLKYKLQSKFRIGWFIKRIIEFAIVGFIFAFAFLEYYKPRLDIFADYFNEKNLDYLKLTTLFIDLIIPNMICWISLFYLYFHLFLNIMAEVLLFADRNFYSDWWNCKNLADYWRLWNLPVHNYFLRHVFYPLRAKGFNKMTISFLIFLISAIGHEYEFALLLNKFYFWAFYGMIAQFFVIVIELFIIKKLKIENSNFGNYTFWIYFCIIGQPVLVTLLYLDYKGKN